MKNRLELFTAEKTGFLEKLYEIFKATEEDLDKEGFMQNSLLESLARISSMAETSRNMLQEAQRNASQREAELDAEIAHLTEERNMFLQEKENLTSQNERLQKIIAVDKDQLNELRKRIADYESSEKKLAGEIQEQLHRNMDLVRQLTEKEKEINQLRTSFVEFQEQQVLSFSFI